MHEQDGAASKASRFTNEVTKRLYNTLRRRVTGNPETDCKFTEEDRVELVETAGLTRGQLIDFAKKFRGRNPDVGKRLETIDSNISEEPETVISSSRLTICYGCQFTLHSRA